MAMTGVLRPGFIQIRVLDMGEALVHYRDRIGLLHAATGDDGREYLKGLDEFDHHSVVLREADEPGMDVFAFKVRDEATLTDLTQKLVDFGVEVDTVAAGEQPGLGPRTGFTIPSGHRIELYAHMDLADRTPPIINPDVWSEEPRGMRATRWDHALLYGPNTEAVTELFTGPLGFSLTERLEIAPGAAEAVFFSCGMKAHDIAFVTHPEPGRFHHASFYLENWVDVGHAGDLMAHYDIPVDIGPTKHGITRGQTIYFFDPSGNRNEVFSGGYTYYPDNPTRSWTPDQAGKAIFYYQRQMNEAFLTVYT